ncbi:MAG TPA: protein kinase [Polyangiaceae bacterium]|jgi:serine/threonine-protein kinase|nr:protein kinase [Polyangiaceae bacterium]
MYVGSYQVLLELARGGMGKVYLARSIGPGGIERLVAIKRAHQHLMEASRGVAERFLDEARIAAHVHHSNVIGVHQAGSDDDGYYLVLDYVEGESLDGLLEAAREHETRVPPQIVLTILCDALAGLHAAHEATDGHGRALRILHRDVSTQNLLVGRDGVTRLSDFGIAKSALSLVVTDEIYVQGKLAYMSPEYLQRKPVDRTLDVYAMGVTTWIALAGALPWPDAEDAQLLQSILVGGVPPLATRAGEVGAEIAAVVDRACSLDPRRRFATARAMLDALEDASKSIGGLARHVEVAEFVEGLVGPELAGRRDLIAKRRGELEVDVAPLPSSPRSLKPAPPAREPSERHERVEGWVPEGPRVLTGALRRTSEKPWRAVVYGALLALVLAIGVVAFRRGTHDAPPAESAAATNPTTTAMVAPPPAKTAAPIDVTPAPSAPAPGVAPAEPSSPPVPHPRARPHAAPRPPQGLTERPSVVPFSTANPYK